MVTTNKFLILISEEIISQYCQLNDASDSNKKESLSEQELKILSETEPFLVKIYEQLGQITTEIIVRLNSEMTEYIDKIDSKNEKAKEEFNKISEELANILNQQCGFFYILQIASQAFSLYRLKTALLPQIGGSIVKIMDAFNKLNHDVHVKRKEAVQAVANLKEIVTANDKGLGGDFDPEEFKKLSKEQWEVKVSKDLLKQFVVEGNIKVSWHG
jgi:hypothetical protein